VYVALVGVGCQPAANVLAMMVVVCGTLNGPV
jgi:hypothetical protein